MHRGHIKLWRKIWDSFIWQDAEALKLLVHLIMKANYKKTEFLFNGKKQVLERGQLICGLNRLSLETHISKSKVNRLLLLFKSETLIEIQRNNRFSLVSIVNYNMYQDYETPDETPVELQWNSSETLVETSKELKRTKKKVNSTFVKPTVEEITQYCAERGNGIDPQYFFDKYEANGWMVGKAPMKDWKATIRTWERNGFKPQMNKQTSWEL